MGESIEVPSPARGRTSQSATGTTEGAMRYRGEELDVTGRRAEVLF
jgi:hypothetical protein